MGNNKLLISAFYALGSYFLLIAIVVFYLDADDVRKIDAISKNTIIELDLVITEQKDPIKPSVVKQKQVQKEKIAKKVVKKSASVSAKQRTNLKSLFGKVSTKAPKVTKKDVANVKQSSMTSRFKSKFEKQTKRENVKVSKITDAKTIKTKKKKTSETKYDNDEYFSKIHLILYDRYNELLRIEDLRAIVNIRISSLGEFSYRFIQNSSDSSFNSQLEMFLEKQKGLKFPPPDKAYVNIEIEFSTKKEN